MSRSRAGRRRSTPLVLQFRGDTTFAPPCRATDIFLLARFSSILAKEPTIVDMWHLRDGDRVSVTNKVSDLPEWFELHPTEVTGTLAFELMRKLEAGWQPRTIVDGPNLWRVRAGDRIAWLGEPRPGYLGDGGLLAILDFHANALAFGEPPSGELLDWMVFGSLPSRTQDDELSTKAGLALAVLRELGQPRVMGIDWSLG